MAKRKNSSRKLQRLRWFLGILFLALAIPAALLIRQGFVQSELSEFRRQQLIAESLVRNIDARLAAAIAVENARPVTDFDYAVTAADGPGNTLQLSPLSSLAAVSAFPGTIGYFQVDTSGQLSTPLLPDSDRDSVPETERIAKVSVETELADVLEANRLVRGSRIAPERRQEESDRERLRSASADSASESDSSVSLRGQAAFDELARIDDTAPTSSSPGGVVPRTAELQAGSPETNGAGVGDARNAEPGAPGPGAADAAVAEASSAAVRISAFAGELEPLRFSLLETDHFVLFRNAWRDGERFVQGMLIDREAFLDAGIEQAFLNAGLASGTQMSVASSGTAMTSRRVGHDGSASRGSSSVGGGGSSGSSSSGGGSGSAGISDDGGRVDGSALYDARLSPPLADIEIAFVAGVLERGPAFDLLVWTTLALFAVLVGGFIAMYRFGLQQLRLAQQQQNFVSAVSHELKTPLTSIRMYGEMLKSGWADDHKKQQYYAYIFDEGERLSRLIDNVLQLARLSSVGQAIALEPVAVGELLDVLRSKLSSQAEHAAFELDFDVDPAVADSVLSADVDALIQVFINLVDNAIKFSGETPTRRIQITGRFRDKDSVLFAVRDFGPGIPQAAMRRLFELFYRPDNELTRTTSGTGIGLALVKQLVTAMSGRVDVRNREPGAEFQLVFPLMS